uniref:Ground-like domain-containing protein n=1 Tax=Parastrongyloides trichosuri TaxID=131310 RepID=A0A0N4ZPW7_PARTI
MMRYFCIIITLHICFLPVYEQKKIDKREAFVFSVRDYFDSRKVWIPGSNGLGYATAPLSEKDIDGDMNNNGKMKYVTKSLIPSNKHVDLNKYKLVMRKNNPQNNNEETNALRETNIAKPGNPIRADDKFQFSTIPNNKFEKHSLVPNNENTLKKIEEVSSNDNVYPPGYISDQINELAYQSEVNIHDVSYNVKNTNIDDKNIYKVSNDEKKNNNLDYQRINQTLLNFNEVSYNTRTPQQYKDHSKDIFDSNSYNNEQNKESGSKFDESSNGTIDLPDEDYEVDDHADDSSNGSYIKNFSNKVDSKYSQKNKKIKKNKKLKNEKNYRNEEYYEGANTKTPMKTNRVKGYEDLIILPNKEMKNEKNYYETSTMNPNTVLPVRRTTQSSYDVEDITNDTKLDKDNKKKIINKNYNEVVVKGEKNFNNHDHHKRKKNKNKTSDKNIEKGGYDVKIGNEANFDNNYEKDNEEYTSYYLDDRGYDNFEKRNKEYLEKEKNKKKNKKRPKTTTVHGEENKLNKKKPLKVGKYYIDYEIDKENDNNHGRQIYNLVEEPRYDENYKSNEGHDDDDETDYYLDERNSYSSEEKPLFTPNYMNEYVVKTPDNLTTKKMFRKIKVSATSTTTTSTTTLTTTSYHHTTSEFKLPEIVTPSIEKKVSKITPSPINVSFTEPTSIGRIIHEEKGPLLNSQLKVKSQQQEAIKDIEPSRIDIIQRFFVPSSTSETVGGLTSGSGLGIIPSASPFIPTNATRIPFSVRIKEKGKVIELTNDTSLPIETKEFEEVGEGEEVVGEFKFKEEMCFSTEENFICCNQKLNANIDESFIEMKTKKIHPCNYNAMARYLSKFLEKNMNNTFEIIIAPINFVSKSHFKNDLFCKKFIEDKYILVYGTPQDYPIEGI